VNRIEVLGVPVDPMPSDQLIDTITRLHAGGDATITYANVHVVNLAQTDMALATFLNKADLVYCDGNGVRLGARMLGRSIPARMTGADWIWELAAHAEGRWRLYWIGGAEGVAAEAAGRLHEIHPGLEIQTDHGFHPKSGPDNAACLERINAFQPDIVLVGMGSPTQEMWVDARRADINAPVVWCVGATADVVSGVENRGPAWLTEHAEWVSRLWANPSRMWRRYLVGNPLFVMRVLGSRLGFRR
jgi:N-acetylglucosaminyldiphosphoundecaprenol N-acetyl-beta-D-mannosaminyltransferase